MRIVSHLIKKKVSTENVALLMVWNMKFFSVTVRSVLFSVKRNGKRLISRNGAGESMHVTSEEESRLAPLRKSDTFRYIITSLNCIESYL